MKTPFPAVVITQSPVPPFTVQAAACTVTELFPFTEQALISIPCQRGRVTKMVKYSELVSSPEKAAEKITRGCATIFALVAMNGAAAAPQNPTEKIPADCPFLA